MEALAQVLNKKYKLASSENFDEVMKALGVGWVTRKVGATVSPVIELTEQDGMYSLTSNSTFKNTEIKFKLGEEFEEETPDGRKVKSIITQDGNKLVHVQKGEKETTIIRDFTPEEVKMTVTVDDINWYLSMDKEDYIAIKCLVRDRRSLCKGPTTTSRR